jgi:hypothetical protein
MLSVVHGYIPFFCHMPHDVLAAAAHPALAVLLALLLQLWHHSNVCCA